MAVPDDRKYTEQHEWVQLDGDVARVGITEFAANALGDVVYLDLPQAGQSLVAHEACGEIESTKSVSDLYAPLSGTVVEINDLVVGDPSRVNADPYGTGWLFTMSAGDSGSLIDASSYLSITSSTQ